MLHFGEPAEAPDAAQYPVQFEIDYVRYYTKGEKVSTGAADEEPAEPRPARKKKKKNRRKK